uniref:Uncharacterized protein n=1 Tax=Arundo donax TaxID=35708 RepID=A0A0A9HU40_ARUDO
MKYSDHKWIICNHVIIGLNISAGGSVRYVSLNPVNSEGDALHAIHEKLRYRHLLMLLTQGDRIINVNSHFAD